MAGKSFKKKSFKGGDSSKIEENLEKFRNLKPGDKFKLPRRGDKQDPEFYKKFPTLAEFASRKAWSYIAGTSLEKILGVSDYMPVGAISAPFIATMGRETSITSPFNTMARTLWLAMHRKYRGIGTYEQADLGIVIFAVLNAFVKLAEAERIYGVKYHYSVINRNLPDVVASALDIAADFGDLAEYRYQLNRLILKAKQLCLPRGFSLLERQLGLVSRVFKDTESPRAPVLVYRSVGYWKYVPTKFQTGSALELTAHTYGTGGRTATTILADLTDQFEALLSDTDVARICSDILAAIGENKEDSSDLVTLSLMPEDYTVIPEHAHDFLMQFHNTYGLMVEDLEVFNGGCVGCDIPSNVAPTSWTAGNAVSPGIFIYQTGNVIHCELLAGGGQGTGFSYSNTLAPASSSSRDFYYGNTGAKSAALLLTAGDNVVVDSDESNPSPDMVLDLTRNIALGKVTSHAAYDAASITVYRSELLSGSELFLQYQLCYWNAAHTAVTREAISSFVASSAISTAYIPIARLSKFDWAPQVYVCTVNSDSAAVAANPASKIASVLAIYGDFDNPVIFTRAEVERLHDVCLLSEFTIPWVSGILKE